MVTCRTGEDPRAVAAAFCASANIVDVVACSLSVARELSVAQAEAPSRVLAALDSFVSTMLVRPAQQLDQVALDGGVLRVPDSAISQHSDRFWFYEGHTAQIDGNKNRGHVVTPQIRFYSALAEHATTVCEVGFNAGHSAAVFLDASPSVRVESFELGRHPASAPVAAWLHARYQQRLSLHWGDSGLTLPLSACRCDVAIVDGGHKYEHAMSDILNMRRLLARGVRGECGVTVVDDVWLGSEASAMERDVSLAVTHAIAGGIAQQLLRVEQSFSNAMGDDAASRHGFVVLGLPRCEGEGAALRDAEVRAAIEKATAGATIAVDPKHGGLLARVQTVY